MNSDIFSTLAGFVSIVVLVAQPGGAGAHEPTPALAGIGDNSWVLVDHGGVTSSLQIMAYSGGWYDAEAHQFCIFGGGHFNYSGNEVWCFDISALEWHQLYAADVIAEPPYDGGDQGAYNNFDNKKYPGALFNPAGEPIEEARPMSRHTYDQMEFAPGHGVVVWGGYAWGDSATPWCVECKDTWLFDFETASWQYMYDGKNPSPNEVAGVGASAYSSHNGLLYAKVHRDTWTYDPAKNRWSKLRTRGTPPWSIEGTLEYDPVHRNLYFFGGNYNENHELWKFDIERRSWQAISADGPSPNGASNNGPGLAYDTGNDVLAVYFGGTIWIYSPAASSWQKFRPAERPSDNSYVFGRFRYDPVNKGFWLHTYEDERHATWFYRYRN